MSLKLNGYDDVQYEIFINPLGQKRAEIKVTRDGIQAILCVDAPSGYDLKRFTDYVQNHFDKKFAIT